jgi:hypothetical protein
MGTNGGLNNRRIALKGMVTKEKKGVGEHEKN